MRIERLTPDDAGEVLTVQRAAYLAEGRRYADLDLPPLTETLDEVRAALAARDVVGLAARDGHRLVGSVRARTAGRAAFVGRLAVAPDQQGRGIGAGLLRAVEEELAGLVDRLELFTGDRSDDNIRLYERHGYVTFMHRPGLTFLEKKLP